MNDNLPQEAPKMKKLRGSGIYIGLFILYAIAMFVPAINLGVNNLGIHLWYIEQIGYELQDYIVKNNDQFPPADKWCDTLVEQEHKYGSVARYEDRKDDFRYTLNKHAFDYNDLPDDMVLLFSGSSGWNKVGGYELIKDQERVMVFFVDGEIGYYRKYQLPHLKWKPEDGGVIPRPGLNKYVLILNLLLSFFFLAIFTHFRQCLKIFWGLALGVGILSALVGAILGFLAGVFYYRMDSGDELISMLLIVIWSFIVGVAYVVINGAIYKKYNTYVYMSGYSAVLGGLTGFIASSIVHANLMLIYRENSLFYLMAGLCFGVIAGLILGAISCWVYPVHYKKRIQNICTEKVAQTDET